VSILRSAWLILGVLDSLFSYDGHSSVLDTVVHRQEHSDSVKGENWPGRRHEYGSLVSERPDE
jgi:hypothetical protein